MSRGSFYAYPIDDPRYGMSPSEIEAYNRSQAWEQEQKERRDEEVAAEIERDIAAGIARRTDSGVEYANADGIFLSDVIANDPFYDFTQQELDDFKDLERSGIFEGEYKGATTYYDKVRAWKEVTSEDDSAAIDFYYNMLEQGNLTRAELDVLEESIKNYGSSVGQAEFERIKSNAEAKNVHRQEQRDLFSDIGLDLYSYSLPDVNDFEGTKALADEVYIDALENLLEETTDPEEKTRIENLITEGAPDFTTEEEIQTYRGYADDLDDPHRMAMDAQAAIMDRWINMQGGILPINQAEQDYYKEQFPSEIYNRISFNTGTAVNLPYGEEMYIGDVGGTSASWYNPPQRQGMPSIFGDVLNGLSFLYPPLAPVFQGMKVTIDTGDLEEGLKAGATMYVGGEITKDLTSYSENLLADANIDLSKLPEPVKQTFVDTAAGVIVGLDADEALTNSLTRQATDYATDWAAGEIESVTGDLGQDLKAFLGLPEDYEMPETLQNIVDDTTTAFVRGDSASDALVDSIEGEVEDFVGDIAEDALKAGAGVIAEALPDVDFETPQVIKDIGDTAVDLLEGPVELIGGAIEPVIDIIDEGLDTLGSEVIDPTLQAIDEAVPHGETPDLPDGPDLPSPDLDIGLALNRPTQTESLFGDEIGKIYRTPIETYKPAFSEREIQGMLSQRFRG